MPLGISINWDSGWAEGPGEDGTSIALSGSVSVKNIRKMYQSWWYINLQFCRYSQICWCAPRYALNSIVPEKSNWVGQHTLTYYYYLILRITSIYYSSRLIVYPSSVKYIVFLLIIALARVFKLGIIIYVQHALYWQPLINYPFNNWFHHSMFDCKYFTSNFQ